MKLHIHTFIFCFVAVGCTSVEQGYVKPPLVHRIDIQQGNEINQSMINKLRVGMDERQVKFIMGTPLLIDPFHPDRWEYIYYKQEAGEEPVSRHISLYFVEGKLSHLQGDVKVSFLPIKNDEKNTERSVTVPEEYGHKGLLDKWFDNKPELNKKKKTEIENTVDEVTDVDKADAEKLQTDSSSSIESQADSEIINAVETDLDIENTKSEDVVSSDDPVDEEYSLSKPEEEPGFFSKMWDKVTGE